MKWLGSVCVCVRFSCFLLCDQISDPYWWSAYNTICCCCCSLACLIHQQQHRLHWGFLLFLFIPRRLMIFRFINIFAFNCVLHCSHSFALSLSLFLWPCLCLFLARFVCTSCDSKVFIKWKINRGNLVGCGAARRLLATTAITINVGKFSAPFHSNKRDLAANSRRVKSEWEKNALFNMKCN